MNKSQKYPIHLCQPDASKSCGACCGLYNWEDHSRQTITSRLRRNTDLFLSPGIKPEPAQYRNLCHTLPVQHKLCETIHNCEFLGFLDGGQNRIGCLLHPAHHNGVDLRDRSFYGTEMCDGHFCPSYTYLTLTEQAATIEALDDWYLYGLVITDIDFVKEFFSIVQNRLGDSLSLEKIKIPEVKNALLKFYQLKESWKFSSATNRLGKYYFSHTEYNIARIDYEKSWNMKPSRFNKIFVSLASELKTKDDVQEAEFLIEENINTFINVYTHKTFSMVCNQTAHPL
ncbi:MAG: hypothetical protein NTZ51_10590 [Proteobacteria bacterium]|nr:hypothetical protein [Pseudomonadota bacterium]